MNEGREGKKKGEEKEKDEEEGGGGGGGGRGGQKIALGRLHIKSIWPSGERTGEHRTIIQL